VASTRSVLQLLRPPNLFTVPGDPLCGALLASHGVWSRSIPPAIIVSLACYCFGLIANDLADFDEDLRDRPSRPLPSGAVSRRTATVLAVFFIVVALAAAAFVNTALFILTVLLLAEILWYNLGAKKSALIGPVAMGLCRGLSVLVGAVAFGPLHLSSFNLHTSLFAAAVIAFYIAAVTALARTETRNPRIPPLIGSLIRGLLFIQAGSCLLAGRSGWLAAVLLLALWPASRLVASRFYAS